MKVKPILLLLAALSACTPPAKRQVTDDPKASELAIVMALSVQETSQLKKGQWALYSVRAEGSTATLATRMAVVESADDTFWIENRTTAPDATGRTRTVIQKYQIDAAAKPLQLWFAELPSERPTKVFPGKDALGNTVPPPKPAEKDASAKVDIARDRITIDATGKTYDCTRLTSKVKYPDGRETVMVTWCSPEVPFAMMHEGKNYGGVVRRTYGNSTLELQMKGNDAVAELPLPEK